MHADTMTPVISTVLPFEGIQTSSLGALLSGMTISQDEILRYCIPVKDHKHLTIMGYLHGENERTYAKYGRERVEDLLLLSKHIADHIVIDCSSNILHDDLSRIALEKANRVYRLITPDLKALSYFDSCLPLISDSKYKTSAQISILSNVSSDDPIDAVANGFHGIDGVLHRTDEITSQYKVGGLFSKLVHKKSRSYASFVMGEAYMITGEQKPEKAKRSKRKKKKDGTGDE